ncbi:MAG: M23 family metallopeptidase [Actinobacteria bacterium]|nr:M23 family metallopeptidase [Actinomycetota bacterium]
MLATAVGGSLAAVAQQADPTTTIPPTTSTTAPTATTTPAALPPSTTTTAPPRATTTAAPSPTTTTTRDPNAPRIVPPEFIDKINSVKRSKPNNTGALLDALAPLRDFGLNEEQIAVIGFGRFPVAGYATFVDDWWNPRFTPVFHLHQGTDIFAPMGTPVRSPADGVLRQTSESTGGISVYVTMPDGTEFYGTHLSAWVDGQKTGQRVKTGDVVGFVGNSGNADGGATHLHFQISPRGSGPVNPKPYLDEWLNNAISNVPTLIASFASSRPRAVVATAMTREVAEGGGGMFGAPASPPRSQLLWATAASPSAGAVHLAEAEVAAAVREAGWTSLTREQAVKAGEWEAADTAARRALAHFTPHALWDVLGLNASPEGG